MKSKKNNIIFDYSAKHNTLLKDDFVHASNKLSKSRGNLRDTFKKPCSS